MKKINVPITKLQKKILDSMEPGQWYYAEQLRGRLSTLRILSTLRSLVNKGYLKDRKEPGSILFPRRLVFFVKTGITKEKKDQ